MANEDGLYTNLGGGQWAKNVQLSGSKTQDLGLNVEGLTMAAGATVYGNWIDNVEWVRSAILLAQSDQQYDVTVQRRDNSLTGSINFTLASAQSAQSGSNWRSHAITGANALLGYSARFGITNSAAVANTYGRIRAQLLGL